MAVQNDYTYVQGPPHWRVVTTNYADAVTSTSSSTFPSFGYGSNYGDFYDKVEISGKALCDKIDQEILDSIYKKAGVEECLKIVTFKTENLWSEPKCLKISIAQFVKEKSQSDITSPIKTLELKMEK